MESREEGQPNYLEAFIKTAQYLAGLTTIQNVWNESAKLLVSFWGADVAGFGERQVSGDISGHDWAFSNDIGDPGRIIGKIQPDIGEVLETGFLSSRLITLSPEPLSLALLPIAQEHTVTKVLLVGHKMAAPLPKELLNTYLGVASLVGTTTARLVSEFELRKHRQHLQELVTERTEQLIAANGRLQKEILERGRAEERTEHLNRVLHAVRNVDRLIVKEKDRDRLIQSICDNLIETRGYTHAWIALWDPAGGLAASAQAGLGEDFLPMLEQLKRGELPACAQKLLNQSSLAITEHPPSSCADCVLGGSYSSRGGMTARLEYDERNYGLLTVSLPSYLVGDEEEQELLRDVSGDIAFALHDMELEQERIQLRAQLFRTQKAEAILTLSGGIAHDFNNLLTVINGYAEIILSGMSENDLIYDDLKKILETGRKGAELIQRLLAFSKKSEIKKEPLNLNKAVENASRLMIRTFPRNIEIETALGGNLDAVNADLPQLEQIIMNLCINAKEAMVEGGGLRIETGNALVTEDQSRFHPGARPGQYVFIEIADTGPGMNKETLERIFDPFFTTKGWDYRKGTGLGLSVAKGIVEQHGGWISCASESGRGTLFRIYLPAMATATEAKSPAVEAEPGPTKGKILLVDDEDLVRDLAKRMLMRGGYEIVTASNGREALEIYAREGSNIGAVILDLIMPQMGGEQCLAELLRLNPNVKVIVSSGHSLEQMERDRLSGMAKSFVNKPYQMKHLLDAVEEAL
jgi:signal transduction histidine kinase/CheY-like chemotaxis protein